MGYNISEKLLPSEILSISTYGKILLFELKDNYFLVLRFGMSGFITPDPELKYNHIELVLEKDTQSKPNQPNQPNRMIILDHFLFIDKKTISIIIS